MSFRGVPLQDLLVLLFSYVTPKELGRFCLCNKELKRSFFDFSPFWLKLLAIVYPSKGWSVLHLDDGEARRLLIDMKSRDDVAYIESFFKWKYVMTRLEAPPASPLHLRFYMRVDTTEMSPTSVTLVGSFFEDRTFDHRHYDDDDSSDEIDRNVEMDRELARRLGTFRNNTNMYARDADGKLKIGKLNEDRYKMTHSGDVFFRADRHTNNNGLLDSYEDLPDLKLSSSSHLWM